jgi:hypothetical protein
MENFLSSVEMRNCFSLLELLIVLTIISISMIVIFPIFSTLSEDSWENFENRIKTTTAFSKPAKVCINSSTNSLIINEEEIPIPKNGEIKSIVSFGKLISSETTTQHCIHTSKPETIGIFIKKDDNNFFSILIFLPTGEIMLESTSEAEVETLKDKLLKGRVLEWFSSY